VARVEVSGLTIQFPVQSVDSRSLKRSLVNVAIGGFVGQRSGQILVQALHNVSLTLAAGDRLALVGPNGSGKTTLLRCLAGVFQPNMGSVLVEGRIGSLLDLNLGTEGSATGYENIRLRGLVAGLTDEQIKLKTDSIAAFSGLGAFLAMPMKTYSSGMAARLAFSVVTETECDVLLMDEWLGVGDADFRDSAQKRLMELVERSSIMVLASHDMGLLRQLCNKVIAFDHGNASPVMPIEWLDRYIAEGFTGACASQ
jgi:lipopolysaccharide transport system ATP-binding protein